MSKEGLSENGKKLSPGQLAYRKALAKKGMGLGGVPLAPVTPVTPVVLEKMLAATCSLCGKPLTRPFSASQGMGDICAGKIKLLPAGITMQEHYDNLTETEVPKDFVLLKEAIAAAREKGCSGYRFIQACGGDRMLRSPLNENFKVVFVAGKRYVSRKALQDLGCLKKI